MKLHQIVRTEDTMTELPKDANVGEGNDGSDESTPTKAPMPEIEDPELKEIDESDTTPALEVEADKITTTKVTETVTAEDKE